MTIVIEDDRIREIESGFVDPDSIDGGATVVDLSSHFVLPGLMDMHVHLQGQMGPDRDRDALRMSDPLMQMRSIHYAMKTLEAGFTTVRDVGSSPQEMYALRDAINRRLWLPDKGRYAYFVDERGRCDGYAEGLGHALVILAGVADAARADAVLANQHVCEYGIPCVWPVFVVTVYMR